MNTFTDLYGSRETIEKILAETKTIAVVGFSSNPSKAGYYVAAYAQRQGYRVIPVNPNLQEGLGERAYASLDELPELVDLVLVFRRSESVPPVIEAAIRVRAKAVWMQQGIVHEDAARQACQAGIAMVMDRCLMVEHRKWKR